jgi:hypothetical protein
MVSVAMVPLLGLWLVMSRLARSRWVVAATLVGITAGATVLAQVMPRVVIETSLVAPLLGALAVVGGRQYERRRLGPGRARVVVPTFLLGGWLVSSLCAGLVVGLPAPFHPAADRVLPVPDGMRATVGPADDSACGWLSCRVTIDVTGRPGQSAGDLRAELTRHLEARGWGSGCRPVGWLLDGSTECVAIAVHGNRATIELTGNRENVRDTTIGPGG